MDKILDSYGGNTVHECIDTVFDVCNVLGHGRDKVAALLLLGTWCTETHLGMYEDTTPDGAGAGIGQFDKMPLDDLVSRLLKYNKRWVKAVRLSWGVRLESITWESMKDDILRNAIMGRLHYKKIPSAIGPTLEDWGNYWKKYYNTSKGKGTPEKFIENFERMCKYAEYIKRKHGVDLRDPSYGIPSTYFSIKKKQGSKKDSDSPGDGS